MTEQIVGSKMPALASDALKPSKAGYGQNGFGGASSDMPGENTQSQFLPGANLQTAYDQVSKTDGAYAGGRTGKGNPPAPKDFKQPKFLASQTREVSAEPYPPSYGMAQRSPRNR